MQTWIPDFKIPLGGLKLATLWTRKANLRSLGEAGGTWDSLGDYKPLQNPSYHHIEVKHAHKKTALQMQLKEKKKTITDPLQS